MNDYRTTVRGSPNRARRFAASMSRRGRRAIALGFAATLLASAFMAPPAARADLPPQPVARLQIVLKTIHIYDDRDWGKGEMKFYAMVRETPGELTIGAPTLATLKQELSAGSGDDVALERIVPGDGDTVSNGASLEGGLPVFAGHTYELVAEMMETDSLTANEDMGVIHAELREGNGWSIGTQTINSKRSRGAGRGDFSLTFEVRAMQLPDLQPTAFRVNSEGFGDRDDQVCFTVQNRGPVASAPFRATIAIDGARPPVRDVGAFGLAADETREQCTTLFLPDSGDHQLTLTVDQETLIPEMNETNNVFQQVLVRTPVDSPGPLAASGAANAATSTNQPPSSTPVPSSVTGQVQADLVVSTIRVNGQVPDDKDDCKDGNNAVTVVVKNAGTTDAEKLDVRLVVDDAQGDAVEKTVSSLEAGKEREIKFDGVRLKKGEHTLTATADAKGAVAESKKDNNERKVTARCQDGD